jgi:hypothetical protein
VRVADALRGRLERLRGENAQLEELLRAADARASGAPAPAAPAPRRHNDVISLPASALLCWRVGAHSA